MKLILTKSFVLASVIILYLTNCQQNLEPSGVISKKVIYNAEEIRQMFKRNRYESALVESVNDSLEINWKPNWGALSFQTSEDSTYFSIFRLFRN